MYHAVIMAGGAGTRLWPLSRRQRPKQVQPLLGERTLFQRAVDRIIPLFSPARIWVVTRADQVDVLAAQAPELPAGNFIVEPEGRGTAPAIGLAAIELQRRDPEAVMAVLTADQFIADAEGFRQALVAAEAAAAQGPLVTLGIRPSFPSTGYGYIEQGAVLDQIAGFAVFGVERFIEKPDLETAVHLVASGRYSWNSGMFVWRVERILEEFGRHMPGLHAQLAELAALLGTSGFRPALERCWPQVDKQTIDYGIMEKAERVAVIPVELGWSDVGSWSSLMALLETDPQGNAVRGPHAGLDTRNSLILGNRRLIATIGVEDLVIVDTDDALLVCRRDREQDVRRLVQQLEERGEDQWL